MSEKTITVDDVVYRLHDHAHGQRWIDWGFGGEYPPEECNLRTQSMLNRIAEQTSELVDSRDRVRQLEDIAKGLQTALEDERTRNNDLLSRLAACKATSEARRKVLEAVEEDIEEMDDEIKRLREALEDVAGAGTVGCEEMQRIAEEALRDCESNVGR